MSARVLTLVIFALVALRAILPAHAPAAVDAHLALAALVLARAQGSPTSVLVAAALAVLAALVSVPSSWHPLVSMLALPAVVGPAAFLLLGAARPLRAGALWGLAVGGALNAAAALVQRFYTWPDALAQHAQDLDANVVSRLAHARGLGLSLSPDLCGALCIAGACAAGALALDAPYRERRVLPAVLAVTSLLGVVAVRSFGSALALGAGAALAVALLLLRRASRGAVVGAAVAAVAAVVALGAAFASRGADALLASASERVANWRVALDVFASAPLTGVGLGRFPAAYLAERTPGTNITRYAHSGPLHWLAETGVVGAALGAVAMALLVRALWQRREGLAGGSWLLLAGAGALAARMVIDYDAQVAQTASVAALLLGLLLAEDVSDDAVLRRQRRVTLLATLLVVPLVVVLFWREGALAEESDEAVLTGYAARFPWDPEARLALGARAVDRVQACTDAEACRAAHQHARDVLDAAATGAHPSEVAFLLRARVHAHAGALDLAERDVDAALALHPGSPTAHRMAVELAQALGDDPAPRRDAARAWHVAVP